MITYYYLHINGLLIRKPQIVVDSDPTYFDSPYVQKVWKIDLDDKVSIANFIVDAISLSAGDIKEVVNDLIKETGYSELIGQLNEEE